MSEYKSHTGHWQPQLPLLRTQLQRCQLGQALNFPLTESEVQAYCDYYGYTQNAALATAGFSIGTLQYQGLKVAAYWWQQSDYKGSVVVVPGLFDHVGIYQNFIQFLLKQGWDVFAVDMPGHGLSEGPRAEIADFAHYSEVIELALQTLFQSHSIPSHRPQPVFLVGQSTGGAAVAHYLMTGASRDKISKAVLLAPLLRPVSWLSVSWGWLLMHRFIKHVPRKFAVNSNDEDFLDFLANRDPLQPQKISLRWVGAMRQWVNLFSSLPESTVPVLIIQGDDDGTVDWRYNIERFKEKFKRCDLQMLQGARHHLVNESARFVDVLQERVKEFLDFHSS